MLTSTTEMDWSTCTDEYQKLVIRMSTPRSVYYPSSFSDFASFFINIGSLGCKFAGLPKIWFLFG